MKPYTPDLQFTNHGTVVTCVALTLDGADWLERYVDVAPTVYIEPRYLPPIVEGARAAGLICRG